MQGYLDMLLGNDADVDTLGSDQLEEGLVRLEDAALLLVGGCEYLLEEGDGQLALARMARLPQGSRIKAMGQQLLRHRRMQSAMVGNAANVLQRVWRRRQLQRREQQQVGDERGVAQQCTVTLWWDGVRECTWCLSGDQLSDDDVCTA
jgi:hypothetical protein